MNLPDLSTPEKVEAFAERCRMVCQILREKPKNPLDAVIRPGTIDHEEDRKRWIIDEPLRESK